MRTILLTLAGFLIVPALSTAQERVEVVKGTGSLGWPPTEGAGMTGSADGTTFSSIVTLQDSDVFCFAGYEGGGKNPARIGPWGNKVLLPDMNTVHSLNGRDSAPEVTAMPKTRHDMVKDGLNIKTFDLWTDKARYNPGQEVRIQAPAYGKYPEAIVRYRHGAETIAMHPLQQEWWSWTPPAKDYQGYMVDVYIPGADGSETILGSIGVDVSSEWYRFPRYGYTAWYDPWLLEGTPEHVAFLNRRHINAVQFQDWHWRHHRPYNPAGEYTDIANRKISTEVIKKLIECQHAYNMKSFFYNLGFGALDDDGAAEDGVKPEWYYYKDAGHAEKDKHLLKSTIGWKSDISFMDPGNAGWQEYLNARNDEVYRNLDFDGFQVDQVGFRQEYLYDYGGSPFRLCDRFTSLLQSFKKHRPDKALIMNSVSKYGSTQIASSGVVDVCYSELWEQNPDLMDIYWVIFDNKRDGGDDLRTVFATYMNYNYAKDHKGGNFNTPGILLADASIFAIGGSHLELGANYNMLCNEYFPNTDLKMPDELITAITRYYDFVTAYENYIYDTKRELTPVISSASGHKLSVWNYQLGPQARRIVVHGKETRDGAYVYHLLNFVNAKNLHWRDFDGDMPEPVPQSDINLTIDCDQMVSKVWMATPDSRGGTPVELQFRQQGRSLTVTVPSLTYWTMLVLE